MTTINLRASKPVAKGGEKLVYFHPQDNNKLIKVINPNYVQFMKKNRPFSGSVRRLTYYWFFANMVIEHIASRELNIDKKHYLQKILGFEDTNLGLGIIVDAIKNRDGTLGLTLGDIIKNKLFDEAHSKALDDFMAWMRQTHIIIRDLWLENLVWHEQGQYFVLVDGIGSRYLPSLRNYSKWYNLRGNNKRADKLKARIEKYLNKTDD